MLVDVSTSSVCLLSSHVVTALSRPAHRHISTPRRPLAARFSPKAMVRSMHWRHLAAFQWRLSRPIILTCRSLRPASLTVFANLGPWVSRDVGDACTPCRPLRVFSADPSPFSWLAATRRGMTPLHSLGRYCCFLLRPQIHSPAVWTRQEGAHQTSGKDPLCGRYSTREEVHYDHTAPSFLAHHVRS